jgi:hypothetical protein
VIVRVSPERRDLPLLEPGSSYSVVLRNLSRLWRSGWSLAEARVLVLEKAGLSRLPRPSRTVQPVPSPTIH